MKKLKYIINKTTFIFGTFSSMHGKQASSCWCLGILSSPPKYQLCRHSPYPSVLDFWKFKFKKLSLTNWIFNLQKAISKLIFAGYTGSKNPVRNRLKIQFVELDFSKLIFQKSNTDQQGIGQKLGRKTVRSFWRNWRHEKNNLKRPDLLPWQFFLNC